MSVGQARPFVAVTVHGHAHDQSVDDHDTPTVASLLASSVNIETTHARSAPGGARLIVALVVAWALCRGRGRVRRRRRERSHLTGIAACSGERANRRSSPTPTG
jgi:hypothetical protein